MNEQPEALRLADFCDGNVLYQPAAAELRLLHWELSGVREHRDEMCKEVSQLHGQLEEAHKEIDEQARLLGMSAERELSLLAEIEQLKKIINKLVPRTLQDRL